MKKITFYIETDFAGARNEVTEEFDDDIKASELDEFAEDFLYDHIYHGWFEYNHVYYGWFEEED